MKKNLFSTVIIVAASLIICSVSSAAALNRIAAGHDYTMAIKSSGTLFGWGLNDRGQLGDSTAVSKSTPTQETTAASNWAIIAASIQFNAAGLNHTAAIKRDGSLFAWGDNSFGQVGDGTSGNQRSAPTQEILAATNWVAVAAGENHTIAIRSDGTLWAWGRNNAGQLGDSTVTNRATPMQIGSATTWMAVAAGGDHTLALRSDGTLWAWGDNNFGQVGDGTSANQRLSPVQIGSDTTWTAVAAGANHSVALQSDGTVWTWGLGTSGRLGHGNETSRLSPMRVAFAPANAWSSIAAGTAHTVAIRSDGTLWAWGDNTDGQIGDNTSANFRTLPTQEQSATPTTWVQAAAGLRHTVAVKTDGTLWAWGDNGSGELGDGTAAPKLVPTSITAGYTIPPFVIATTPANRASHVAVGTRTFTAVFDRAMKASTINSSTFTIGSVSGSVTFNAATRTATFTSSSDLAFSTTYTATITTAATDASDIPLGMNFSWTFTTVPKDSGGGGSCFIATAAFGSYLHPHVQVLKAFRDRYLVTNSVGRLFVGCYYRYSPRVATVIEKNTALRTAVRWVLTPVVYAVRYPVLLAFAFVVGAAGCAGLHRVRSSQQRRRTRRGGP